MPQRFSVVQAQGFPHGHAGGFVAEQPALDDYGNFWTGSATASACASAPRAAANDRDGRGSVAPVGEKRPSATPCKYRNARPGMPGRAIGGGRFERWRRSGTGRPRGERRGSGGTCWASCLWRPRTTLRVYVVIMGLLSNVLRLGARTGEVAKNNDSTAPCLKTMT
eukprot:15484803-Alexandrium_andersonii.AAC.2